MVIDDALTAIERENERLKGILPKNFARQSWISAAWVMWWISGEGQIRQGLSLLRREEGISSLFYRLIFFLIH